MGTLLLGPLAAMALCEIVLRRAKLQSRLAQVVAIHVLVCGALLLWLAREPSFDWGPAVVFWTGSFLLWFGVRSHLESSILLRMLCLLHERGAMSRAELLALYRDQHGAAARLDELRRGGYIVGEAGAIVMTDKGRAVARGFTLLARLWRWRA